MTKQVDETLADRGRNYGDFSKTFAVIQQIKLALQAGEGWDHMPLERREALEMIAVKMGRLVSGDSGHADSWHDIAGYARLVEGSLTGVNHTVLSIPADQLMTGKQVVDILDQAEQQSTNENRAFPQIRVRLGSPGDMLPIGEYRIKALVRYAIGGMGGLSDADFKVVGLDSWHREHITDTDYRDALRRIFSDFM